jgi:hypothetical protein
MGTKIEALPDEHTFRTSKCLRGDGKGKFRRML